MSDNESVEPIEPIGSDPRLVIKPERDRGATRPWYSVHLDGIALKPRLRTAEYARVFALGVEIGMKQNAEHETRAVASRAPCSCSSGFDPECKWYGHHPKTT